MRFAKPEDEKQLHNVEMKPLFSFSRYPLSGNYKCPRLERPHSSVLSNEVSLRDIKAPSVLSKEAVDKNYTKQPFSSKKSTKQSNTHHVYFYRKWFCFQRFLESKLLFYKRTLEHTHPTYNLTVKLTKNKTHIQNTKEIQFIRKAQQSNKKFYPKMEFKN